MSEAAPPTNRIFHDLSEAVVSQSKIQSYLLQPDHPQGGPKAQFFLARGFHAHDWHTLARALTTQGQTNPVELYQANEYGRKIVIRCKIVTPDGINPCIVTVWMEEKDRPPRLVTAYPG